jgi:hypothetical protein
VLESFSREEDVREMRDRMAELVAGFDGANSTVFSTKDHVRRDLFFLFSYNKTCMRILISLKICIDEPQVHVSVYNLFGIARSIDFDYDLACAMYFPQFETNLVHLSPLQRQLKDEYFFKSAENISFFFEGM